MAIFTPSLVFELVAAVTTLILGLIAYVNYKYSHWSRVGLPALKPSFPYGNTKDQTLGDLSYGELNAQFYRRIKSNGYKHGGLYSFLTPVYMPVDPEIIKSILQKDFQHFVNHGVYIDEENDPLSGHLFNLEDEKWRRMRVKLTPTFTSGKMKMMFQTLADCTVGLKAIMDEAAKDHTPVDIKDTMARFTTDIIGSVAFGLECNSLKDPNAIFRSYGRRIFTVTRQDRIKRLLQQTLPSALLKLVKFKLTNREVEDFFMKAINDTVEYREKNNITRKDFLQLLIQLKNDGILADDDKGKKSETGLSMKEVAAQAYVFFLGGFETSSTTMTFAVCEIASHPDIQDKIREEINTVLAKHGGKLTYDAVMEMTYLDKVIQETLRKYPPVPIIIRKCTKDYIIPNTSILLEKGTRVSIAPLGLQRDPEFYPDPDKFDPERFSEENKKTRPDCTWLPFGEGPRHCIGLRFGLLQSRVGLVTLLKNFKIKLNQRTKVPIQLEKRALVLSVEGGVWLDVEKIN